MGVKNSVVTFNRGNVGLTLSAFCRDADTAGSVFPLPMCGRSFGRTCCFIACCLEMYSLACKEGVLGLFSLEEAQAMGELLGSGIGDEKGIRGT